MTDQATVNYLPSHNQGKEGKEVKQWWPWEEIHTFSSDAGHSDTEQDSYFPSHPKIRP